jgi:hypothetical protein
MATGTGILAQKALSQSITTYVYNCPANNIATITVSACNRNAGSVRLTLNLAASTSASNSATLGPATFLEKSAVISGYTSFERAGIVLGQNNKLFAWTNQTAAVSLIIWGFEESA